MNLLTLKKGNKRYDLQINNIKYCVGNNFEEKYNFVNILKEVFLLSKESEYSINNSGQAQALLNDKEIKVKEAGAAGIRANTKEDIAEIRKNVDLPIIGIVKRDYPDCKVYITPTMKEIDELMEVKPEIIAIDATKNLRPNGNWRGKSLR